MKISHTIQSFYLFGSFQDDVFSGGDHESKFEIIQPKQTLSILQNSIFLPKRSDIR